jgi:hypothetical protein
MSVEDCCKGIEILGDSFERCCTAKLFGAPIVGGWRSGGGSYRTRSRAGWRSPTMSLRLLFLKAYLRTWLMFPHLPHEVCMVVVYQDEGIFIETVKLAMNNCSKIILQRTVLLMLQSLGVGFA